MKCPKCGKKMISYNKGPFRCERPGGCGHIEPGPDPKRR